ncbi:MAG: cytochrome c3 family protein [Candidatus Methylomirabilales bacterium]
MKRAERWSWLVIALVIGVLAAGPSLAGQAPPPDVEFDGGGGGKVVFKHDTHTKNAKCTDCHTKVFKMTKGQRSDPKMKEMQEGKSCGACHDGKKAFGVTAQDTCARCHKKS